MGNIMGFIEFDPPVKFENDNVHIISGITTYRDLPGGQVNDHANMSVEFFPRFLGGSYAQILSVQEVSSILTQARQLGVKITVEKKKRL